ncbi:MAG: lamin tail domain-containing protein [Pirellulales bacterium]
MIRESGANRRAAARREGRRRLSRNRIRRWGVSGERLEDRHLLAGDVVVSEFMAVNASTLADTDGEYSDWIELKNITAQPIDLKGYYLTDDSQSLTKWQFPTTVIGAGQTLVVFASGKNRAVAGAQLHTNFQLNSEGDDVWLVAPDGVTPVHGYENYPTQLPNVSYGLPNTNASFVRLLSAGGAVSYLVPGADRAADAWTSPDYPAAGWNTTIGIPSPQLAITEVIGDDTASGVELQNVSGQTVNTSGWKVLVNQSAGGVQGVNSTAWSLPASVPAGGVLFRTDLVGDANYWGANLDWTLTSKGWVMLVNNAGQVVDFAAWGYSQSELASLSVNFGGWTNLRAVWTGDGAAAGELASGESFVAYNDHVPGPGTGSNVTSYAANGLVAGALRNVATGNALDVTLTTSQSGALFQTNGAAPAAGTDAYEIFNGFVDFTSSAGGMIEISGAGTYTQTFSGLDTGSSVTYDFAGTSLRGNSTYTDRWTLVTLVGAESATPAHSTGAGVVVVSPTQAAIWVGANSGADQGFVAAWTGIDPGADGEFSIVSSQYTGATPGVGTGSASAGSKGYAISGIRLQANALNRRLAVLRRIGQKDTNRASDFERTDVDSRGVTNPGLTVPFQTQVPAVTGIGFSSPQSILYPDVATNIGSAMQGINASLWTRFEFDVTNPESIRALQLHLKYDDGYIAYLNGVEVAQDNAPDTIDYQSAAIQSRLDSLAATFAEIDISDFRDQLRAGRNVLAIQALNASANDADLLLLPELTGGSELPAAQYMTTPTPRADNVEGLLGKVTDTKFSVDRGFYSDPIDVAITTATPGAQIRYTLDGSPPTASTGSVYTTPLHITGTTVLRAAAFLPGYLPASADTQTYIFVQDIVQQTSAATLAAGFPASWNGNVPDYGIDPDVVGPNDLFQGKYTARFADSLQAIPSFSFVLDIDDMFGSRGIYSNPNDSSLEVPTSAELIYPDGTKGFQIDAGLKIQGGAFRSFGLTNKKSFRLKFKSQYGASTLKYPLFGDGATNEFDTLTFRMESNDGWQWSTDPNRLYARDQFGRLTQLAMGQPGSHGRHVHLYVNGFYWGLYNLVERPDETFASRYIGGAKEEWDAQNSGTPINGDLNSWNTLRTLSNSVAAGTTEADRTAAYLRVLGQNPDGSDNPDWENYLDVDNYIDYLIVNFYGGNGDWPFKNYYMARRRGPESTGFQFFVWDYEWVLNLQSDVNTNRISDNRGVAEPFSKLRSSAEFRLRFADRVQKHFFNGGALYVNPANPTWSPDRPQDNIPAARFAELMNIVDDPLVAESARWGDQHRTQPMTVDESWRPVANNLLTNYFRLRSANMLTQFRGASLFPTIAAPVFSQQGGFVTAGYQLTATSAAGEIYWTTDGSDPRLLGGAINPSALLATGALTIQQGTTVKARVLSNGQWSALNEAVFSVEAPAGADALRITEVNYHPHDAWTQFGELQTGDADDFEFIELQNVSSQPVNLGGVRFTRGIDFVFANQSLAAGERIVIVANRAAFASRYGEAVRLATGDDGLAGPAGVFGGSLSNSGETLKLVTALGATIQEFAYQDAGDWPERADGKASSLEIVSTNGSYTDPSNWRNSARVGGTPGTASVATAATVVINEVLANSDAPEVDRIELYNGANQPVSISRWYLSDSSDNYLKYQFPAGAVLPVGGYRVLTEADFNPQQGLGPNDFLLSSSGDSLWLMSADPLTGKPLQFVDRVEFQATQPNVSLGRLPNGTGSGLTPMKRTTWNSANGPHRIGEAVISEVHYNPSGAQNAGLEFIELLNTTTAPLDISGWTLSEGVDWEAPAGTVLPAGGTLTVVGFDPASATAGQFRALYGISNSVPLAGPWQTGDVLDNGGETITLGRPTPPVPGSTTVPTIVVDQVRYDDDGAWPSLADGLGASLQRRGAGFFGSDVTSWVANQPTPGSFVAVPSQVVARQLFYNGSKFDGNDDTAGAADDLAIATDKVAYRAGSGAATIASYSSYDQGINGLMIDVQGMPGDAEWTAQDLVLRVGRSANPDSWSTAPTPASVSVRRGAGKNGSDRVTLVWADRSIVNQWLEVSVQPTFSTALGSTDRFYFGNAVGETGNRPGNTWVDGSDVAMVRDNPRSSLNPAAVDHALDFNRDGLVDPTDMAIAAANSTNFLTSLNVLNLAAPLAPTPAPWTAVSPAIAQQAAAPQAAAAQADMTQADMTQTAAQQPSVTSKLVGTRRLVFFGPAITPSRLITQPAVVWSRLRRWLISSGSATTSPEKH